MTTKEYLETATGVDNRIDVLARRIIMLKERASRITSGGGSGGSAGAGYDKVSSSVESYVTYEKEIKQIHDEFLKFSLKVETEIHRIRNNTYATLLEERYIEGQGWEHIAEKIGYSDVKYVRETLHNRALSAFDKISPQNTRFIPSILLKDDV